MQRSMIRGLSTTGKSPGQLLFFWVLTTVASVWVIGAPIGAPGEPQRIGPESIECPECGNIARRQLNGSYECTNNPNHISWVQPDGSYKVGSG